MHAKTGDVLLWLAVLHKKLSRYFHKIVLYLARGESKFVFIYFHRNDMYTYALLSTAEPTTVVFTAWFSFDDQIGAYPSANIFLVAVPPRGLSPAVGVRDRDSVWNRS